jgi:hypothetical protein
MKQAILAVCLLWTSVAPAWGQAPTSSEKAATVAWLSNRQQPNGGFAVDAKPATPATLTATLSAVRALKYFGATLPRAPDIVQFVRSCWNEKDGGFAPTPGGKPDVRTTAIGMMALVDLKAADQNQDMISRGMAYQGAHVKDYEDARIAAAAVEATKKPVPEVKKWLEIVRALPATEGGDQSRDTGGSIVAFLRLGEPVGDKEAVLKVLRAGQRPSGAWGKTGGGPELETSYRVMRAFFMLKAKPDVAKLRQFIARCRQADGSYAVAPGQPSSVSATYNAGIISYWLDRLEEIGGPR